MCRWHGQVFCQKSEGGPVIHLDMHDWGTLNGSKQRKSNFRNVHLHVNLGSKKFETKLWLQVEKMTPEIWNRHSRSHRVLSFVNFQIKSNCLQNYRFQKCNKCATNDCGSVAPCHAIPSCAQCWKRHTISKWRRACADMKVVVHGFVSDAADEDMSKRTHTYNLYFVKKKIRKHTQREANPLIRWALLAVAHITPRILTLVHVGSCVSQYYCIQTIFMTSCITSMWASWLWSSTSDSI